MIDLRSDTFSLPSMEMRNYMSAAEVGDDYYGEDKSACWLQDYCKELFGKEDALFVTSGMLANQLAIGSQTTRGNEVVTEYNYHINLYESAQYAALCHIILNGRQTSDGVLLSDDVRQAIESKPRESPYAQVELVSIENTINSWQGKIFPLDRIRELRAFTQKRGIGLHLDGARIFNAHIATGVPLNIYAAEVDSLSISFSKGLGAPFGAVLLGSNEIIGKARRLRTWYGSGFHQIGFYARAALFAMQHQLDKIAEDHRLAKLLAFELRRQCGFDICSSDVDTNMVFLEVSKIGCDADTFEKRCYERGLKALVFPPNRIRLVICRNVNENDVIRATQILVETIEELQLMERVEHS